MRLFLIFLLLPVFLLVVAEFPQDPYATLGIRKGASVKDAKRAYKSLAREWHPDKNDSPGAADRFMAISKAYEILSDPLKKERYDKFGAMDDSPQGGHHPHGGFDNFFGFGGGFGGYDRSDSFFQKHRISMRLYSHTILEKSNQQPFILFAYSGYCQLCFHLEPVWKSIVEDLEPLGYGIGTINAMTDGNLLERLRVTHLPSIMVLVEGRVVHFRGNMPNLNAKAVRVFARDVIPSTFMLPINTRDKLKRFVDQWSGTNKVSVLILGAAPEPRLRYTLTAMKYSNTARFAYVHLGDQTPEVQEMRKALDIKCTHCENILVFNDYPENGPIARLSISNANQLTVDTLNNLLDANKYLTLPRLSSAIYLDDLCPVSSRNPRRLCAILVVMGDSSTETPFVDSFRQFAVENANNMENDKVRLTYLYANKQKDWLKPFLEKRTGDVDSEARDILVIWRYEHVKARFTWMKGAWSKGGNGEFGSKMSLVVQNAIKLDEIASVGNLIDESAPSMWTRLCRSAVRMAENIWFNVTKEEAYPILSALATFMVILLVGYGLSYLSREEKKRFANNANARRYSDEWHPEDPQTQTKNRNDASKDPLAKKDPKQNIKRVMSVMEPIMHELRAESIFGMVRLLKPGCRSIIVLVDAESKERLLEQFACTVFPLRNNKTFSFGYLMVEKNLPWFRKLLEHTLPGGDDVPVEGPSMYERLKAINPRQTIGTVLVLCGWKLYFSIYHPMHTTPNKKHFLGFDDDGEEASDASDSGEEEAMVMRRRFKGVNVDNVLNGFGNWLDRLLEGSMRRYYIPEWPENIR